MINYRNEVIYDGLKALESFNKYAASADPINLVPPTSAQHAKGVEPLNTLPAPWFNVFNQRYTVNLQLASQAVDDLYTELKAVLTDANITPTSATPTQLRDAIRNIVDTRTAEVGSKTVTFTQATSGKAVTSGMTLTELLSAISYWRIETATNLTSHANGVSSESNYGHAKASTVAGSANGTASKGTTPTVFAQSNHVHPLQTSVSGNAGTADKWKTSRNITISDADGTNTGTAVSVDGSENETLKLPATIKATLSGNASTATKLATARKINGVSFDGSANITIADSTKAPISHASSATTYGASNASNYGHAKASSTTPKANGTAAVGAETSTFARGDHVHPLQTSVSGNASTATAPLYQWKKLKEDLHRYVAGESPTTTYYWHRVCKITTAMTFDVEVASNHDYSYRASYRLSVSQLWYEAEQSYTVALFNLGQAVIGYAELAIAIDADGYLYIQTNAVWQCSLHVTLLYSALPNFSITMDKLGYAPFGTESGFTPVKVITQTGAFRWTTSDGVTHSWIPIINTDIIGNVTGNLTGNAATASKANVRVALRHGTTWFEKSWTGLTGISGSNIWTDGENIYYSNGSAQHVLNKATSTWFEKTWTGLTTFKGSNIWTDGENIYYSAGSAQHVLNKATSTWFEKSWTGLTNFNGSLIWTDGENIYYSNGSAQHVLNKATSTWFEKTWTGLTNFNGSLIWTDGENIYHSNGTNQYVLNKATSTWTSKSWTGLTTFPGSNIWTDGDNIYYSWGTNQYVLNKATSTWTSKSWTGLTTFHGSLIWTDGENIYHSESSVQHVLPATRHNYVDENKYQGLFGVSTNCNLKTLTKEFVFSNE